MRELAISYLAKARRVGRRARALVVIPSGHELCTCGSDCIRPHGADTCWECEGKVARFEELDRLIACESRDMAYVL